MRLELSRRAQADLDDIRDYSVDQFGVERAILYLDTIEQGFRLLVDYPQIGRQRSEFGPSLRSYSVGEHRIMYEPQPDVIHVIRLLHKAMDVEQWV